MRLPTPPLPDRFVLGPWQVNVSRDELLGQGQVHKLEPRAMRLLVEAGLVERVPHPVDRRTTLVSITDTGREVVEAATTALNGEVFGALGIAEDDQRALVRAIDALRREAGEF